MPRLTILAALSLLAPTVTQAVESGDFCQIARLDAGAPAEVNLPYIGKQYCGAALIDGKYVRLADITDRMSEGQVSCTDSAHCTKTNRYITKGGIEYIIVFKGPKNAEHKG